MISIVHVESCVWFLFFFFKQKTAYEMRISDWSSDVCSSDLGRRRTEAQSGEDAVQIALQFVGGLRGFVNLCLGAFCAGRPAAFLPACRTKIGRASCRARVCQYV